MRRFPAALAALFFMVWYPAAALEPATSEWAADLKSRMRIMSGPDAASAGIEIVLEQGFKTYWRSPGESGVPPQFDFSGSTNLSTAEVLFPAPQSFEDGGGFSIGYHDRVIFPVRVAPLDASRPVVLNLKLNYGVCEKICIPATGEASLQLGTAPDEALLRDLEDALAAVPARKDGKGSKDEPQPVFIAEAVLLSGSNEPSGQIRFDIGGDDALALYAEGPERWYLETLPSVKTGLNTRFTVNVYGPRKSPVLKPCPLKLTIIGKKHSVERSITLDECRAKP